MQQQSITTLLIYQLKSVLFIALHNGEYQELPIKKLHLHQHIVDGGKSCSKGVVYRVLGSFLISFMAKYTGNNRIAAIIKGSGTSFTLSIANPEYSLLVNTVLFVSVSTISNLIKKLLLKSRR